MSLPITSEQEFAPPYPSEGGAEPGVLVESEFWHFDEPINTDAIAWKKRFVFSQKVVNLVFLALFLGAVGLFVYQVILLLRTDRLSTSVFTDPSLAGVFLWMSVLLGLFLFYRFQAPRIKNARIPVVNAGQFERTDVGDPTNLEKKRNIGSVLSDSAREAIEEAYHVAKEAEHAEVLPLHMFTGAMSSSTVQVLFARLGVTFDQLKDPLKRRMLLVPKGMTVFGSSAKGLVADAFAFALEDKRKEVSSADLFYAAYRNDTFLQELFFSVGAEERDVRAVIGWIRINERLRERYEFFRKEAAYKPTGNMDRAYTAIATPFLDRVSFDLTRAAVRAQLPLLIDREREMDELMRVVETGNGSVVLVGPPGVGKESILFGVAERMVREDVPKRLKDKRLLQLDIPLIASAQGGTGAEERLLTALREVGASGNIVVVIKDIDAVPPELLTILGTELDKGYTFVIGTASPHGYLSAIETTPLKGRLQKIDVKEPGHEEAIRVVQSKIGGIENTNKVFFTFEALSALVELSDRYLHEAHLPKKAVDLAREVALVVAKRGEQWARVAKKDVADLLSSKTSIPISEVDREEGAVLLNLEEQIHERVIGQDEAVKAVSASLRRARAELRAENRPISNFLFLGPTGVGKTELAKATAEVYFGNEDAMLRFDMSEFQEKASLDRLIGGEGRGGVLTEAVRKQPFSLLLLDELEKAHPDILNIFLQVMDDGRLTDGTGRTIDFTNVIIIATSNAGAYYIQDAVAAGKSMEEVRTALFEKELRDVYRPEFLNRFDGVIVFKPLDQEDVVAIAYLMMKKVIARLEAKGMHFMASDEAMHELAKKGFDPKYGARPLRRVIQETVDNAMADILLKGEVSRRDTFVLEPGGQIRVEKAKEL